MHTFLLKIIFTSLVNLASLSAEINGKLMMIIDSKFDFVLDNYIL